MKVVSIEIQNLKGFEYKELSLDGNFTLLVGENGSGKTTILEALKFGLPYLVQQATNDSPERAPLDRSHVRQTGSVVGDAFVFKEHLPLSVSMTYRWEEEEFVLSCQNNGHDWSYSDSKPNMGSLMFAPPGDSYPVLAYYRATAFLSASNLDWNMVMRSRPKRKDGYLDWFSSEASSTLLIQWLGAQEAIFFQERIKPKAYQAVADAIVNCLPDALDVRFDAKQGEPVVEWNDGSLLPFSMLSDGQRGILALVGDIARRCAVLNPHLGASAPENTPGVVLIDELDAYLHPRWQKRVVGDLKRTFPQIQFVATSHSPFVIQSLDPGELRNLDGRTDLEYWHRSLEDIADVVMGVENPSRSLRYQEMLGAAEEYFGLLKSDTDNEEVLSKARSKFHTHSAKFAPTPAMEALLKLEGIAQEAKRGTRNEAGGQGQ